MYERHIRPTNFEDEDVGRSIICTIGTQLRAREQRRSMMQIPGLYYLSCQVSHFNSNMKPKCE